jgi:hypothetical protein
MQITEVLMMLVPVLQLFQKEEIIGELQSQIRALQVGEVCQGLNLHCPASFECISTSAESGETK